MGSISEIGQIGRTTLFTRFEVRLRFVAALLALLGAAAAFVAGEAVVAWLSGLDQVRPVWDTRPLKSGYGPLLDVTGTSTAHLQFPLTVSLPPLDPWWPALLIAVPLFALWMRYVVNRLVLERFTGNLRHHGLATAARIRMPEGLPAGPERQRRSRGVVPGPWEASVNSRNSPLTR